MNVPCIAEVRKAAIEQLCPVWQEQTESAVDWLLCDILKIKRPEILLKAQTPFPENDSRTWDDYIERAKTHEPIQHILGKAPFRNLELISDARALIPRPETEQLIDWILSHVSAASGLEVLDLATGSGCIALSLASELGNASVTGADFSDLALAQAVENQQLNPHTVEVKWVWSNLFESLQGRSYDLIVSNPPYISHTGWKELPPSVQQFEPEMALTDKQDGLQIIARIIEEAPVYLRTEGWLYLEIGEEQEENVRFMLQLSNFIDIEFKLDYAGRTRMVRAKKSV